MSIHDDMSSDKESNVSPPQKLRYLGLAGLLISSILGLFLGSESTWIENYHALWAGPYSSQASAVIMWWVRIPQILTTLCAGAVLATSGAAMQNLMRNELADPYLIGVAAGGGLGAALAIASGLVDTLGLPALTICSFLGALSSSVWIDLKAKQLNTQRFTDDPSLLVLTGVALNLFLSALLTLTVALSGERLGSIWRWLIGHISILSWLELSILLSISLLSLRLLLTQSRALEILTNGSELAWSLGLNIQRVRNITLLACSLGVGVVVSYCGIIGFVGLLVPHFIRPLIQGHSHKLLELSMIFGAWSLLLCHISSMITPINVPIGVVTGVIGGGAFLMTLNHQKFS